jgi:hypothetical protein
MGGGNEEYILDSNEYIKEFDEEEYHYEELSFDEWISEHDEEAITLMHDVTDRARSYGLPILDHCHVTDFLFFCYNNSSSKYRKVPSLTLPEND